MARINFACRQCGRKLVVAAEASGRKVRCPDCGTVDRAPVTETPFAGRDATESAQFRYDAFISYRHTEPDRKWAKWLHASLETYRTPRNLVSERGVRQRLGRVFRDEEELPASADLSEEIEKALKASRFLIVICSPRTPKSKWVNAEVARFRELGRHDRILALLIEGEPGDSFPRALVEIRRSVVDASSNMTVVEEVEPLAADVRPRAGESAAQQKRMAMLRLLACILGVRFDDLRQREKQRRRRRNTAIAASLAVLMLGAGFAVQRIVAERQRTAKAQEQSQIDQQKREKAEQQAQIAATEKAQAEHIAQQEAELRRIEEFRAARATAIDQLKLAYREAKAGQLDEAEARLQKVTVEHRQWEWHYIKRLCSPEHPLQDDLWIRKKIGVSIDLDPKYSFLANADRVQFSPDGRYLAVAGSQAGVIDLASGEAVAQIGKAAVAFSPDGALMATVAGDADLSIGYESDVPIEIYSTRDWTAVATFAGIAPSGGYEPQLAFLSDSRGVVVSGGRDRLSIWHLDKGWIARNHPINAHALALAVSSNGRYIATAGANGVHLFSAEDLKRLKTLHSAGSSALAFSPDGFLLACGGQDGQVRIWHADSGSSRMTFAAHDAPVRAIDFNNDGTNLVTAGDDGVVRIWSMESGQQLFEYRRHSSDPRFPVKVTNVTYSRDGRWVASLPNLRIWEDLSGAGPLLVLGDGERQPVMFSDDGLSLLASAPVASRGRSSSDVNRLRIAEVWNVASGELKWSAECSAFAATPDLSRIATTDDEILSIWDGNTSQAIHTFSIRFDRPTFHFSADGRYLAALSRGVLTVWDISSGEKLLEQASVHHVALSPDGRYLAVNAYPDKLIIYQLPQMQDIGQIKASMTYNYPLKFSPDGTRLAYIGKSYSAIWQVDPLEQVARVGGRASDAILGVDASTALIRRSSVADTWQFVGLLGGRVDANLAIGERAPLALGDREQRVAVLRGERPRWHELLLFDTLTGAEVMSIDESGADGAGPPVFSRDGRLLAVGSMTGIEVWGSWSAPVALTASVPRRVPPVPVGSRILKGRWTAQPPDAATTSTAAAPRSELTEALPPPLPESDPLRLIGSPKMINSWRALQAPVIRLVVSPDGRRVAASDAKSVMLWSWQSRDEPQQVGALGLCGRMELAFSPDGRYVVTLADQRVQRWDPDNNRATHIAAASGRYDELTCSAVNPTASVAAYGFDDDQRQGEVAAMILAETISTVENATLQSLKPYHWQRMLSRHRYRASCVAVSVDGRFVLSGGLDKTVRLHSVKTGRELARFEGHSGQIVAAAFSPNLHFAVSVSKTGEAQLWHLASGEPWARVDDLSVSTLDWPHELRRTTISERERPIRSATFSADDRLLYLASGKQLVVFDTMAKQELARIEIPNLISSIAALPRSGDVLIGQSDGTVALWRLPRIEGLEQSLTPAANDAEKPDPKQVTEQEAARAYEVVELLLQAQQPGKARDRAERLIADYPDTQAAAKAKQLLEGLPR